MELYNSQWSRTTPGNKKANRVLHHCTHMIPNGPHLFNNFLRSQQPGLAYIALRESHPHGPRSSLVPD